MGTAVPKWSGFSSSAGVPATDGASMTPAALRASVRHAMTRSEAYGVTAEVDVLTYLNVMYMLGFEFDADPRFADAHFNLAMAFEQIGRVGFAPKRY